jgi:20S proteasome alpha/beta subunit
LGIQSKEYVILAALKRSTHELSSHQKKIFKVCVPR